MGVDIRNKERLERLKEWREDNAAMTSYSFHFIFLQSEFVHQHAVDGLIGATYSLHVDIILFLNSSIFLGSFVSRVFLYSLSHCKI